MAANLYKRDLPSDLDLGSIVAIDTETMGLNPNRDRLCVVQLSSGDGHSHIIQIEKDQQMAPNLCKLLKNPSVLKLFHFGRFDIAVLLKRFNVLTRPVYCTKIASKLVRTYTDKHGLKNLINELLELDISKQQQSSYWGARELTNDQINYAASDVLHLHKIKTILDVRLKTEGRIEIADKCFKFLPSRAQLDILGWPDIDIFAH
jgi:ribonuclease D